MPATVGKGDRWEREQRQREIEGNLDGESPGWGDFRDRCCGRVVLKQDRVCDEKRRVVTKAVEPSVAVGGADEGGGKDQPCKSTSAAYATGSSSGTADSIPTRRGTAPP